MFATNVGLALRYLAKGLDLALCSAVWIVVLGGSPQMWALVLVIDMFLFPLIEAAMLYKFGTTPGKFVFGVVVRTGKKTTFWDFYKRSTDCYAQSMCMGFPIIFLFALLASFVDFHEKGATYWDTSNGFKTSNRYLKSVATIETT